LRRRAQIAGYSFCKADYLHINASQFLSLKAAALRLSSPVSYLAGLLCVWKYLKTSIDFTEIIFHLSISFPIKATPARVKTRCENE
jgi:hypothetical protein